MNRISKSLLVGLVFSCTYMSAQKVSLEGRVLDSLQAPLELANVIAVNKNSNGIASFGITDAQGRFKLNLQKDSLYIIRASYLGFETYEETYQAIEDKTQDIILKSAANELDGVTVVEDFPVTISGDTITYKTDAFTTGKEKKLENVLEQLPGFQIDDEGQIKVQGKDVSKVLVEGKEFFDGDTKMATKNIPANAVDKVQVLRNFNEIGPLGAVNDSDALALNIKLKEGKKNLWFGDITAGGGPEERHLGHANVFYYSPKFNINFIGDLNNIGQQAFTLQDYFKFNGGLAGLSQRSGSTVNISADDIGLSLLQNNRTRNTNSKLAALNFNYNPNKKIRFAGFGIVSGIDTDLATVSQRTYIREDGNNQELLTATTKQQNTAGLFKFSSTYTPNAKWHLSYNGFIKNAEINDQNLSHSNFNNFENEINSTNLRDPFSVQQNLNVFYAGDNKNIFSLESNQRYKRQRPNYNLVSMLQPFMGTVPLQGNSPYNLFQAKEVITNKFDAEGNYYRVLNKTNHISFKAGLSSNKQDLISQLEELVDGNQTIIGNAQEYVNNSTFDFLDVYFGLGYRIKLGKLTLSPQLNYHIYDIENRHVELRVNTNKSLLLPELRTEYALNSSQSIQLNYNLATEFADVQRLAPAFQLQGYNSLFRGNVNLENATYHNLALNYFNFSSFSFTTIYGGLTYQKRYESIGTTSEFIGLDNITTPINIERPNENVSFFGNYERRFPYWKGKLDAQLTYSNFNTIVNQVANFNRSFNQNYKLSLETRFKEAPNVEIGFEKQWNDYASANIKNRFVTDSPFANIEAYFLKSFSITADYQYNNYRSKNGETSSTYDFLNAALYFQKEDSKWEFKISGLNLLNTTSIRQDAFSNNLISTLEYQVQPRYFVFSLKYEL